MRAHIWYVKITTTYSEIYTLLFHETNIWRKYTILDAFLQNIDNQYLIFLGWLFLLSVPQAALRKMPFRNAKDAFLQLDTYQTALRNMPFGNSKRALSQLRGLLALPKIHKNHIFVS
ncbi:MAG: hypothetical protein Q3Y05_01305 [Hallella sp.]|nr:hypothetical protein [Hallella sp.]